MRLEILGEETLIGKRKHIADLLYSISPAFKQCFRLKQYIFVNPLSSGLATYFLNECREIFRADIQRFGIILYGTVLSEISLYQLSKTVIKTHGTVCITYLFQWFGNELFE